MLLVGMLVLVFNNSLIIQYGKFTKGSGNISDYKTYTGTFPISFPSKCFTGTGITGTANGVVGAEFNSTNGSTIRWSMKPNHDSTANQFCFFIAIGF